MKTPTVNSFTVHRLGIERSFFPFGFDTSQKETVSRTYIHPQRVIDMCDIIEKHALEYLVVFDVEQYSLIDPQTEQELSIEGLAAKAQVPFWAIDSRIIVLPKQELLRLLSTFRHYNLNLFDSNGNWHESEIKRLVSICDEHDWHREPMLLPKLTASRFYLISDEDRHVTVETYDPQTPRQIFSKALQFYAGTVLAEKYKSSDIADIPQAVLDAFWKDVFSLTILEQATKLQKGYLKIGVSRQLYDFKKPLGYPPEFRIVYELQSQKWFVEM